MARIIGFCLAAALALSASMGAARTPEVGKPSPKSVVTLVDGTKVDLASLKGQVVVINFWATWCVPCRVELPLLDRYYRTQAKHGLKVFAITTEDSVPLGKLKKLFGALAITPARRISGGYAVLGGLPTNYVIDRAGVVRYAKASAFDLDDLNREIVPLLQEPVPAS